MAVGINANNFFQKCWIVWMGTFISLISGNYLNATNPKSYQIGGVLRSNESKDLFIQAINDINLETNALPLGITLNASAIVMDLNPIRVAYSVCENLIANQVYAVIMSHSIKDEFSPAAVSYTCGFYHIPVIGISSRATAFSDKKIHSSFLRTVPPYSHQADVWIEILRQFRYRKVIFIHSSDADGNGLQGRFQNLAQHLPEEETIKVEKVIEFQPGLPSLYSVLQSMKNSSVRVYLLYASTKDAEMVFRDANFANITKSGYVWLVSEQALDARNKPNGILGLKLINSIDEALHIEDSVHILAKALHKMYNSETIMESPKNCHIALDWDTGSKFVNYIKKETLIYGKTGYVAFDDNGDRRNAEYDLINIQNDAQIKVGKYSQSKAKLKMELTVEEEKIIWPGNEKKKPEGFVIPSHLRVATLLVKPFVWGRSIDESEECKEDEIMCPLFGDTNGTAYHCCWGYCIELLKKLATKLNITYTLHLGKDGQYGSFEKINRTKREWNGLVGEIVYDEADMVIAPLTINPERSQVIDFSKPFKYQGITILEKRQTTISTLESFLQPFKDTMWILVLVAVHVVALVLCFLDRLSPFGRFNLFNKEGGASRISSAIWFAWGLLLNCGVGEGTPRCISGRILAMVWAGFAMIIVASYTANLAAFLVLERPETSLSGINDARLRNPVENFTFATVKGSAVDMYFRRQVELSNMYRVMESYNYDNAEEAIEDVKRGKLKAFIWDSSRLEFEIAQDCQLLLAGELFGRSGFGIALKKNSPWLEKVSLAVLNFHETGYMEHLENEYIHKSVGCSSTENAPATLGLKNMSGVFILVIASIMGGIGLIIIESIYHRKQNIKQRKAELARRYFNDWRRTVLKRRILRSYLEDHRPGSARKTQTLEETETDDLPNGGCQNNPTNSTQNALILQMGHDGTASTAINNPLFSKQLADDYV